MLQVNDMKNLAVVHKTDDPDYANTVVTEETWVLHDDMKVTHIEDCVDYGDIDCLSSVKISKLKLDDVSYDIKQKLLHEAYS